MIWNALAAALDVAAILGYYERKFAEVERLASDLIELSTRHSFVFWLAKGAIYRGWARSASGDTAEGIRWIEHGIRDYRATGTVLVLPTYLARKAEALHLANRTSEALEAIGEAEVLAERFEQRYCYADLNRLRGVFLTAIGSDEIQIERRSTMPSELQRSRSRFHWRHARKQPTRNTAGKASGSGGHGFRLPL